MTREEKVAIARVMSDIVKANGRLLVEQFTHAKKLHDEFHLSMEDLSASRNITFSAALDVLREMPTRTKKELCEKMKQVATADGACDSNEALLLTTMQYALHSGVYTFSVPTMDAYNMNVTLTYMEKQYVEVHNTELKNDATFRLINGQCALAGMRFAYIPYITSAFTKLERNDVVNILRYMSPALTEDEAVNVGRRMGEITTSEFYLKVLHLPMQSIAKQQDAFLLVNIGISMTPYCMADGSVKFFKDYMCLPINGSVLNTIDEFLAVYKSFLTAPPVVLNETRTAYDFMFYKHFFDFLLTPPPVEPDLVFMGQDFRSGKYYVALRFGDNEKRINLTPKEYDAFYEIVYDTFYGKTKGKPIGLDRTNLAPIISHIRQKITAEVPEIALAERYKPERTGNVYSTNRLDKSKVFVRRYTSPTEYTEKGM